MKNTRDLLRMRGLKKYNLISLPTIDLTPKEADHFLDCIYDESVMKNYARFIKMTKPVQYVRHIGFGEGKFLYPSDTFDESKYKKQWVHNRITLTAKTLRGCAPIYDDDITDNIEGVKYKAHLMEMIAKKIANEMEYANYMGDTHSYNAWCDDDIESLWDGWRYIINNSQSGDAYYNKVCGAADIKEACEEGSGADFTLAGGIAEQDDEAPYNWEFKYHHLIKNMPSKYKSIGLKNFVFLNSDLVTQDYIAALSARATALGDAVFTGAITPQYGRIPIVDVPLMPTNLGTAPDYGIIGAGDYTDVILTPNKNLIIGIMLDIQIEPERSAADRCTYYFYTLRGCCAIENVNAVVFLKCLTHEC